MPKLKTRKSVVKRFKITKKGKVLKKRAGQGHFNSRESGNTTRKKRRMTKVAGVNTKNLKTTLPYS